MGTPHAALAQTIVDEWNAVKVPPAPELKRVTIDPQAVIVVGTAANGAVLYTSSGAALRGLKVIVPVDGMSAGDPYVEQYTTWHLVNAPRVGPQVTLTRMNMIQHP